MNVLELIKRHVKARAQGIQDSDSEPLCTKLDSLIRTHLSKCSLSLSCYDYMPL